MHSMFPCSTGSAVAAAALLLCAGACGSDPTRGRGVWDVSAGPRTCTVSDTGAASNEDPGTPLVIDLQADGAAVITFDDGASIPAAWLEVPGDPSRPKNDPARLPSIQITVPDFQHGGASWSIGGLPFWSETGDLSVVRPTWQAVSSRTTTVTHSICTAELVATQR
jgi:hypothetical protein